MNEQASQLIGNMYRASLAVGKGYGRILLDGGAFMSLSSAQIKTLKLAMKHQKNMDKQLFKLRYREV